MHIYISLSTLSFSLTWFTKIWCSEIKALGSSFLHSEEKKEHASERTHKHKMALIM